MPAKGLPTMPCPRCGAYERIGTEKCFACGSPMYPTDESRGVTPDADATAGGVEPSTRRPRDDWTSSEGDDLPFHPDRLAGGPDAPTPGAGWAPMTDGGSGGGSAAPPPEGPFNAAAGYGYGQGYGGYGTGYGAPSPGYGAPVPGYGYNTPKHEKGATTALLLGIFSFICCPMLLGPAAIIEGRKARQRIAESYGLLTGDTMALVGMILGGIAIGVWVASIVLRLVVFSSTGTNF